MTRQAKQLMQSELAKNREISRYGVTSVSREERSTIKELDLTGKAIQAQAVTKMIRDYAALETLDLTNNVLGNHGAKDIAKMIDENNTIRKLVLRNC